MDAIVTYLRESVMGKTLHTDELTYTLEDGRLEGIYEDQLSFTNLLAAPTGLRFDLFVVSRERVYQVVDGDSRARLRQDYSGASHLHYELAQRQSTGRVTGFIRFVAASFDNVPAEAMAILVDNFRLENVRYDYDGKCLDVDPFSLARSPSTSLYPVFTARER